MNKLLFAFRKVQRQIGLHYTCKQNENKMHKQKAHDYDINVGESVARMGSRERNHTNREVIP